MKVGIGIVALAVLLYFAIPAAMRALNTISTDDAYVNGHVTFVAARVPGQVMKVMVDDNNAVHKGDLLVALDKQPYEAQVEVRQAAVARAQADLGVAKAMARGTLALARNKRWRLERAMEEVHNQVALLDAKVADVDSRRAVLVRAQEDFDRVSGCSLNPPSAERRMTSGRRLFLSRRRRSRWRLKMSIRSGPPSGCPRSLQREKAFHMCRPTSTRHFPRSLRRKRI